MSKKGPHESDRPNDPFDHTIRSKSVEVGAVFLEANPSSRDRDVTPSWGRPMPIEVARTKEANGRIVPADCKRTRAGSSEDEGCPQP
jgi:hypothetical protein